MIFNIVSDQYASGSFQAIEVSGMDKNRNYLMDMISMLDFLIMFV